MPVLVHLYTEIGKVVIINGSEALLCNLPLSYSSLEAMSGQSAIWHYLILAMPKNNVPCPVRLSEYT
jgi:hypothetical protein